MAQQYYLQPLTSDIIRAYHDIFEQLKGNHYPTKRLVEMMVDTIRRIGHETIVNHKVTKISTGRAYDLGKLHLLVEGVVAVQVYCNQHRLGENQRKQMRTLINESDVPVALMFNFGAGSYDFCRVENKERFPTEWQ